MYLHNHRLTSTHIRIDPAHDLQAMDRAYRFGQTRDVFVYRLLGAGSIEELIYARQLYKQQQMAIGYQASVQTRYFRGSRFECTISAFCLDISLAFKVTLPDKENYLVSRIFSSYMKIPWRQRWPCVVPLWEKTLIHTYRRLRERLSWS